MRGTPALPVDRFPAMTRHQRLQKNMRSPGRQHHRSKNRAHRAVRRAAHQEMAAWLEQRVREQSWFWHERTGMLVHRPQDLIVVTYI